MVHFLESHIAHIADPRIDPGSRGSSMKPAEDLADERPSRLTARNARLNARCISVAFSSPGFVLGMFVSFVFSRLSRNCYPRCRHVDKRIESRLHHRPDLLPIHDRALERRELNQGNADRQVIDIHVRIQLGTGTPVLRRMVYVREEDVPLLAVLDGAVQRVAVALAVRARGDYTLPSWQIANKNNGVGQIANLVSAQTYRVIHRLSTGGI